MKKFLVLMQNIILMALIFSTTAIAKDITFEWDANTEANMAGYALFQRTDDDAYDYTKPIDPTCTMVDGGCYTNPDTKVNTFTIKDVGPTTIPAATNLTAVFNKSAQTIDFSWKYETSPPVTYSWVARATNTDGQWSADSNEVSKTFDLAVTHWKLYQANTSGGPYTEILDTPWDGTSDLTASLPADTLAPGSDYYFTVVGFTVDGLFSSNSNEVRIDRRPPTKVINLKITLQ